MAGIAHGRRKAAALGVALGLHAAVVVAWGLAAPVPSGGRAVLGEWQAERAAVVSWLRLLPGDARAGQAMPPAEPEHRAVPMPPPLQAPSLAADPAAPDVLPDPEPRRLQRGAAAWAPSYPDTSFEPAQVRVVLALQLDAQGRVIAASPVGPVPVEELVQHLLDELQQVTLVAAAGPGALPATACLEVRFDAAAVRVDWQLGRCAASGAGRRS